jgi:hypothetical protein
MTWWSFVAAMIASLLTYRRWASLPSDWPLESAAFASGLATFFAGMAIGIPGFLAHAHATTSLAMDAMLHKTFTDVNAGYSQGQVQGFAGLSIFTFFLTPAGWLTMYLVGTGTLRGAAAWFGDPVGDPVLAGIDEILWRTSARARTRRARSERDALEGPEIPDRVVTGAAAGIPGCDIVVVSSRRKEGWERGTAVFAKEACYRIGEPVERTIAGRLRTLYPLTEHRDLEAIRRSVQYDMPTSSTD